MSVPAVRMAMNLAALFSPNEQVGLLPECEILPKVDGALLSEDGRRNQSPAAGIGERPACAVICFIRQSVKSFCPMSGSGGIWFGEPLVERRNGLDRAPINYCAFSMSEVAAAFLPLMILLASSMPVTRQNPRSANNTAPQIWGSVIEEYSVMAA